MKQTLAAQVGTIALRPLYESELAAGHLALERNDAESLHDLRVALRRLTVLVEQLAASGHGRKTLLRKIRGILRQSNQGRDAQVMLSWLQEQWPHLDEGERVGARQWQRKLKRQLGHVLHPGQITTALQRLLPALAKQLPRSNRGREPLGFLVAQRLEQQTDALISLMRGESVQDQLHLIRLKAKTVRYLLLPFIKESVACAQAESALRKMQTVVGDWHDAVLRQQSLGNLLRNEVKTLLRDSRAKVVLAERSPALPGLLTLARSSNRAQRRLAAHIEHKYLHDGSTQLSRLLHQAVAELRTAATGHGLSVTMTHSLAPGYQTEQ
jgi:CHAD domain-containing protein